jgi:hypothetical protein
MRAALLLGALALPPLIAARVGAPGPLTLRLNLGPGDGPYVAGFPSSYDVAEGTALQWSGPDARIALPLRYTGPAELLLRFGPPRGGPAQVNVALDDRPLEAFECCERPVFQRRRVPVFDGTATPVRLSLRVSGPEAQELGLLLDWVALEVGEGGRVVLRGTAGWRPPSLVAVAFLLLLLYRLPAKKAALACAPLSLALTVGLLRDPWLVHRLLTVLPESLLAFGLVAAALARLLEKGGMLDHQASQWAPALAVLVFLLRAAALNHPDYYYPDLMSHARRTAVVERAGLEAFASPAKYLDARAANGEGRTAAGLWLYRIGDRHFPLPYSLVPYAPVALLRLDYDATLTALKLYGAACSALPIVLVAALAHALGAPASSVLLAAAAPTAMAELSFASMPALFGHAFDLALLVFLAARLSEIERPRLLFGGALLLAAAQLAYISSTVTTTLIVACLGLLAVFDDSRGRGRARSLLLVLILGSGLSVLLYYRDFVGGTFDAVRAALASSVSARPTRPGPGRIEMSLVRWAVPLVLGLALAGVRGLLRPRTPASTVFRASLLALGLVAVVRLSVPVVFGHVHLALFLTPLLCLAAGAGLDLIASLGARGRTAAWGLLVFALGQGVLLQARLLVDQLGRAR